MNFIRISVWSVAVLAAIPFSHAALITAIPGPDDQGGMLMPMVTIINTDDPNNPTSGDISINFSPTQTPQLQSLQSWSPGAWFDTGAAWRSDLGSPAGIGGTPVANAGNGDLFNNQYGFMFMSMPMMGMAIIPTSKSLGIELISLSSPLLESYNYVNSSNLWDQVFPTIGSQVLWNGNMWHNYFTLPAASAPGTYSATFEVFIADTPFTGTTGWAQYDASALNAAKDINFNSTTVDYTWTVIPEPSTYALLALASLLLWGSPLLRRKCKTLFGTSK